MTKMLQVWGKLDEYPGQWINPSSIIRIESLVLVTSQKSSTFVGMRWCVTYRGFDRAEVAYTRDGDLEAAGIELPDISDEWQSRYEDHELYPRSE